MDKAASAFDTPTNLAQFDIKACSGSQIQKGLLSMPFPFSFGFEVALDFRNRVNFIQHMAYRQVNMPKTI